MGKYVPPCFAATSFTCIFCETLTVHHWSRLGFLSNQNFYDSEYWACMCEHCKNQSLWLDDDPYRVNVGSKSGSLIRPNEASAALPHADLPDDCKADYNEAREISARSPRGAAALLRLCLQRLCVHLGGDGKNINNDIAQLVKKGLAPQVQQALDYVRVTGNHAVHPGEISLEESPEHVAIMFDMINLIVEELIHRPRLIAERFANLPAGALSAIEKRDAPKLLTNGSGG